MLHATPTYTLRTEVISIVSEHLLCTIGGGNASGLIPDSIPNSSFELQTHRRYHSWTVQPSENTESARGSGRSMEALHEESRYALYRCHLLRECHALSDRCQPMEQRAQSQTCLSYAESWQRKADAKLLWECIEKVYPMMCQASRELGILRMRTKYLDVSRDNMAYVKQRRHTKQRTRKIIRRLLDLLGKILSQPTSVIKNNSQL